MAKVYEGKLVGNGIKAAIVVSRFNELIVRKLLEGALDGFKRHAVDASDVDVIWVPGAYEIPLTAKKVAATGRYQSVVCLGAVIRGNTPHFDFVAAEASKGVASVGLETNVPIIFGVLTTDTTEQALERAGVKSGNKGYEAAVTAIEMINLYQQLEG